MVKVKICGITNMEDALAAVEYGADALGFVFYKKSPRYVKPNVVKSIISKLPPFVSTVGLFVNENKEKILQIADYCNFRTIQLHGNESPRYCLGFREKIIKAFRVSTAESVSIVDQYKVSAVLLDAFVSGTPGGTGRTFDWNIALAVKERSPHIILSGGLNSRNVADAVSRIRPYAVDVSSGVEKEYGRKDHKKLEEFLTIVRSAST